MDITNTPYYRTRLYRLFEMIPGVIAWTTLIGMVLLAWRAPLFASLFIIAFDLYWLLKTVFFTFHIAASYRAMRKNLSISWLARVREPGLRIAEELAPHVKTWEDLYHLVILPAYEEPYEVIRASVVSLMTSSWPNNKMIVVLGIEERAGAEDRASAERIKNEFGHEFFSFFITIHPSTIPGELPGKGSNAAWAAREAKKYIDSRGLPYE